jgi:hypothetical protein
MEQRVNIKFCFKLCRTAMATCGILRTGYGNEAWSRDSAFEWFKRNVHALVWNFPHEQQ